MPDTIEKNEYISSREAMEIVKFMPYTTFHRNIKNIDPGAFQIEEGGRWRFHRKAVEEYVDKIKGNGDA